MKSTTEVERWFAEKKPPTEATMRKVREIILGADRRMTEYVKYGTLTFGYDGGDFATMVQVSDKKQTSVMFNRGARIPGKFPHLEARLRNGDRAARQRNWRGRRRDRLHRRGSRRGLAPTRRAGSRGRWIQ